MGLAPAGVGVITPRNGVWSVHGLSVVLATPWTVRNLPPPALVIGPCSYLEALDTLAELGKRTQP